ncbi:MAG TPA: hemin uptake protein HemP [Burkholderiales bacterium]
MSPKNELQPEPAGSGMPTPPAPARVSSEALLGARGELLIVHNGREYRLRLTQNGKLILTA